MKNVLVLALAMAITPVAFAGDITAQDWKAVGPKGLNATSDLKSQTQALLTRLLPNADLIAPSVGEAMFVDLDGDKKPELVATVDYSGRSFFNNVVIVQQTGSKFTWTETHSNGTSMTDLANHVVDVDGDGTMELVMDRYIDRYEGAERAPRETLVYRWNANHFKEDSDSYPAYYREKIIPVLEASLNKASQAQTTSTSPRPRDDYETFVLKAELDRAKKHGKVK